MFGITVAILLQLFFYTSSACLLAPRYVNPRSRQADAVQRACAVPGGTGLRMVFGSDLHHRHHLRRVGCGQRKDSSKQRALGSTTCSSRLFSISTAVDAFARS